MPLLPKLISSSASCQTQHFLSVISGMQAPVLAPMTVSSPKGLWRNACLAPSLIDGPDCFAAACALDLERLAIVCLGLRVGGPGKVCQ